MGKEECRSQIPLYQTRNEWLFRAPVHCALPLASAAAQQTKPVREQAAYRTSERQQAAFGTSKQHTEPARGSKQHSEAARGSKQPSEAARGSKQPSEAATFHLRLYLVHFFTRSLVPHAHLHAAIRQPNRHRLELKVNRKRPHEHSEAEHQTRRAVV